MQPTKEEIKLASPCYNAIKAIAGERECATCKGKTHKEMVELAMKSIEKREGADFKLVYTKKRKTIIPECQSCHGLGKVGWKWELTIGDKVCRGEMILFYAGIIPAINGKRAGKFISDAGTEYEWPISIVTPIIPWETIEQILKGVGYPLKLIHSTKGNPVHSPEMAQPNWFCQIWKGKYPIIFAQSNTDSRQEAVMLAVIALAKEMKK